MIVLETIEVAFAMFSALPVPQPVWNEKNMRYAMCAFPLVGFACAGFWWVWSAACWYFSVPYLLQGAGLCLIPVLVTGGIHLDGYADTCDALASNAGPAKKQEILKDPRCGAFAVIRLCTYFVAYLALCEALEPSPQALWCMGWAFVLERALSGLSICRFLAAHLSGCFVLNPGLSICPALSSRLPRFLYLASRVRLAFRPRRIFSGGRITHRGYLTVRLLNLSVI